MKKKLFLLTTFIISFVVFTKSINAAQELTCVYETMYDENDALGIAYQKKIIQDSIGNITYYYLSNEGKTIGGIYYWRPNENAKIDFDDTSAYDKNTKTLTKCPECVSWKNILNDPDNNKFTFKDKNSNDECGSKYAELQLETTEIIDDSSCKKVEESTQSDINNTIWLAKCDYSNGEYNATVYLNNETYILNSSSNSYDIFSCINHSELLTKYNERQEFCPKSIYFTKKQNTLNFYLEDPLLSTSMTLQNGTYYDENGDIRESKVDIDIDTSVPNSCRELFGENLIDEINKVMKIIRITVPILLLVLGITDFFRATFSNNEDNMKKDRDRFIKRIIAAIIIFIIPTFVNLVLKISNNVWSDINQETCIDE